MLTLLEGPDGAGKTTLAEWLVEQYDECGIDHHGPYAGEKSTAHRYFPSVAQAWTTNIIMDRGWQAEPIYSRNADAERRKLGDRIGVAFRRMLDRCALTAGGVFVVCIPPRDVAWNNWLRRKGREYIQQEAAFHRIWEGYWGFLNGGLRTDLPVIHFDYTKHGYHWLHEQSDVWRAPANEGPGIGCWTRKSILMVGEAPGTQAGGTQLPFVHWGRQGASYWLGEQLERSGVGEDQLYWVNAQDHMGEELKPDFIERMHPKGVIALGKVADQWCDKHGVKHEVVDHPQYWKRFHSKRDYPLINLLKEMAHG